MKLSKPFRMDLLENAGMQLECLEWPANHLSMTAYFWKLMKAKRLNLALRGCFGEVPQKYQKD